MVQLRNYCAYIRLKHPSIKKLYDNVVPLFIPLFLSLDQFQYRDLEMSEDDLSVYRWALKSKGVVMTTTFFSTSFKAKKAKVFAEMRSAETNNKQCVLMIFQFNKKHESAINLCK